MSATLKAALRLSTKGNLSGPFLSDPENNGFLPTFTFQVPARISHTCLSQATRGARRKGRP
ncbi:hypothetical protein MYX82_04245, partial [Acidobacteria bacterium AH-259-D05]|nr:hypothetical protein [Acidobacteria bacterium AH-259-D05]